MLKKLISITLTLATITNVFALKHGQQNQLPRITAVDELTPSKSKSAPNLEGVDSKIFENHLSGTVQSPKKCKLGQLADIPTQSGAYNDLWICSRKGRSETLKRNYTLVVPNLKRTKNLGLLLALHGGGGTSETMSTKTDFHSYGEKYAFVTVYPQGYLKKWNSGHIGTEAPEAQVDDVHFLSTLIDELSRSLKLDKSKVFVTGHSNGAMMSHRLGAEISQKIAGIAPVAGTVGGFADIRDKSSYYHIPKASSKIQIFAIHGKCDTSVTYDGARGPTTSKNRKDIATIDGIDFWASVNSCGRSNTKYYRGDRNLPMIQYSYGCGKKNDQIATVQLLTINDTGHKWPDGSGENQSLKIRNLGKIKDAIEWGRPRGCSLQHMTNSSSRINASEIIVREFFKKN